MLCDCSPWNYEFQTPGKQQRQLTPSGAQANFSEIIKGTPSMAERDKTSHMTFPAAFWHATSHNPSDRSSVHSIDSWLIAPKRYCQPSPPSELPVVKAGSVPTKPGIQWILLALSKYNFRASILHFPILCSWQSRTAFETGRRTHFYSPPPHQSSSAHSRCLSKRIMKSWFRGLVDTPCAPGSATSSAGWWQIPGPSTSPLPVSPQQWAAQLKHLQTTSQGCKPVEYEDRHEDTTPHGTCHTAQLFLVLRALLALNTHPSAIISVCVLLSPCHRQPPTRCGSTRETLLEDVTQQFAHKTEKGMFLRQCTPQIHPLYCTYTFNISSL